MSWFFKKKICNFSFTGNCLFLAQTIKIVEDWFLVKVSNWEVLNPILMVPYAMSPTLMASGREKCCHQHGTWCVQVWGHLGKVTVRVSGPPIPRAPPAPYRSVNGQQVSSLPWRSAFQLHRVCPSHSLHWFES